MTMTIPGWVKAWKNVTPQGATRALNKEIDLVTFEVEDAIKNAAPEKSGALRDSIEVRAKATQRRDIEIEVRSNSDYFWQREKGGSLPRRKPGPMVFAPDFSPFAGHSDTAAAIAEAKSLWDKVFRPPGSQVILGERDGEIDVLFIIAKTVNQEGSHFARRGFDSMKPEIKRVARNALRRYIYSKS